MSDSPPFEVLDAAKVPRLSRSRDGFNRMDVVNAFQQAFDMIGGTTRLTLWANENPADFYRLYAKLMPSTAINIQAGSGTLIIEHATPTTALDESLAYEPRNQDQLSAPQALHAVPLARAEVGDPRGASASRQDGGGDQRHYRAGNEE